MNPFSTSAYAFGPMATLILVVGVFVLAEGFWVWRKDRSARENSAFLRLVLVMAFALLPISLSLAATSQPLAFYWDRWSWFFACLLPAFTFVFEATHLGLDRARRWFLPLYAICFAFALTVPFGRFVSEASPWRHWFGTLQRATWIGWLFIPFFFSVLGWCLLAHRRKVMGKGLSAKQHRRYLTTYAALFFATLGSLDFLGYVGIPWPPLSFVFFTVWVTLYAYAIVKYKLFRVTQELAAPAIIASMPGALFVVDKHGLILIGNEHASKLIGIPTDGLEGRRFADFLTIADAALKRESDREVLGPTLSEVETELTDSSGVRHPVTVSSMAVRDETSAVRAYAFIVMSIRKLAEQADAIARQNAALEKAVAEMRHIGKTLEGREAKLRELEADLARLQAKK